MDKNLFFSDYSDKISAKKYLMLVINSLSTFFFTFLEFYQNLALLVVMHRITRVIVDKQAHIHQNIHKTDCFKEVIHSVFFIIYKSLIISKKR